MIAGFNGEYSWLSNFWPALIRVDEVTFNTVEHAYVIRKLHSEYITADDPDTVDWINHQSPAYMKKMGRAEPPRPDWDDIKLDVMLELTRRKYSEDNPELREKLLATGDEYIEETNHWHDTFWGVCNGIGQNHLGHIIMKVRDEIRNSA
jgi:ribA/ribD-fused uncharacterized protein